MMIWIFRAAFKMALASIRHLLRQRLKHLIPALVLCYLLCDYMGVFVHRLELDYYSEFSYPLEGDLRPWMAALKRGEAPAVEPVNRPGVRMVRAAKGKCVEEDGVHYTQLRLVILVKSALENFDRRAAIRDTWGFERRFSDVPVRTVFLLGSSADNDDGGGELAAKVEEEHRLYGDLVQGDFRDAYFNNTLKSMMGLRWATELCPTSRFYLFVDDDYYVSVRNLLPSWSSNDNTGSSR